MTSGEVHCWCVSLDVSPEVYASRYATLACDERCRSERFRFERDRRRFVVARGALRECLGRYLGTEPGQIRFAYNAFGKPRLAPEFGSRLKFNLSHSADRALIAIVSDAEVGVDLEYVRAEPDFPQAFLRGWTEHEACLKALGTGLAIGLDSVSAANVRNFSLYSLQPAPGYVGALAIEGSGWRLSQYAACWQRSATPRGF